MTTPMWLAFGGALGALIRMLADKNVQTLSKETAVQVAVGAASMGMIGAIPAEWLAQFIPGAGQFAGIVAGWFPAILVGFLGSYAGLDLSWLIRQRLPKRNGNGGPGAKIVAVFLLVAVGLAAGACAQLGIQSTSVSFDRNKLAVVVGRFLEAYGATAAIVTRDCAEKRIPAETCAHLAKLQEQGDKLLVAYEARTMAGHDLQLDDLAGLVGTLAQLARLAGYPVPNLGTLGPLK